MALWTNQDYLVPMAPRFDINKCSTAPKSGDVTGRDAKKQLRKQVERIAELQRCLYAGRRHSVLLVFQAMDAAGKDSTIRHVLTGVNPAGCRVVSFKAPNTTELAHDFLWRSSCQLPSKGIIGVFNRSYYEEVLAVRVNPNFLPSQHLPNDQFDSEFWSERFESIVDHERHLARQGTVILKFWLNVSKEEQKRRLISRIDRPEKNWKFDSSDMHARQKWPEYMQAYEDMLDKTSTGFAPWYAIPADDKPFMRLTVATIVANTLESLNLNYPTLTIEQQAALAGYRKQLAGLE